MFRIISFILIFILSYAKVFSQENYYVVPYQGHIEIKTDNAYLRDNGGILKPLEVGYMQEYLTNSNGMATIFPETKGKMISIYFQTSVLGTRLENTVYVYDGPDDTYPILAIHTGNSGYGKTVTATNKFGALTVKFVSNQMQVASGFYARISTVNPLISGVNLSIRKSTFAYDTITSSPGYLNYTYYVKNSGSEDVIDRYTIQTYLSADTILDETDIEIATRYDNDIPANTEEQMPSLNARIPDALPEGAYWLISKVDGSEIIRETNELDNYTFHRCLIINDSLDYGLKLRDELTALDVRNSTSSIGYYVYRNSQFFVPFDEAINLPLELYLSEDEQLDQNDKLISTDQVEVYGTDDAYFARFENLLLDSTDIGDLFLIATMDASNPFGESNSRNNIIVSPVHLFDSEAGTAIDLSFSYIHAPQSVINDRIYYEYGIFNNSNQRLNNVTVGVYYSEDDVFDENDFLIFNESSSIGSYQNLARKGSVLIPENLNISTNGRLFFQLDSADLINETDETNNLRSLSLTSLIRSDFDYSLDYFYINNFNYQTGGDVKVSYMIKTDAVPTSLKASVSFYVSTDTILDDSDDLLLNTTYGLFSKTNRTLSMPNLSSGKYYLIGQFDPDNVLSETNEDNNIYFLPFWINGFSASYDTIRVEDESEITTCNGIFFDDGYDQNMLTGERTITINPVSASDYVSINFHQFDFVSSDSLIVLAGNLTSTDTLGIFSNESPEIIQSANSGQSLSLIFKQNSKRSGFHGTIGCVSEPFQTDFMADWVMCNNQGRDVDPIYVKDSLTLTIAARILQGNVNQTISYSAYISDNMVFDEGEDILLQTGDFSFGRYYQQTLYSLPYFQFPEGLLPGSKTIFLKIDAANEVEEKNEENNIVSLPIYLNDFPKNKFVMHIQQSYPKSMYAGGKVYIRSGIRNLTNVTSDSVQYGFALQPLGSESLILFPNQNNYSDILYAANERFSNDTLVLPDAPSGNYRIVTLVYDKGVVLDSFETNFLIRLGEPSLSLHVDAQDELPITGEPLAITTGVFNLEEYKIQGQCTLSAYFTSSDEGTSSDILIDSHPVYIDENHYSNISFYYDGVIPAGMNQIRYEITSNSGGVVEATIEGTTILKLYELYANIELDTVQLSFDDVYPLESIAFTYTYTNYSSRPMVSNKLEFYLSTDNTFDSGDIHLETFEINDILSQQELTGMNELYIPEFEGNNMFVIVRLTNPITESNYDDNWMILPINKREPTKYELTTYYGAILNKKSEYVQQDQIRIGGHALNNGYYTAPSYELSYYLSLDEEFSENDYLITSTTINNHQVGREIVLDDTYTLPAAPQGTYFVIGAIDLPENTVNEYNEDNNTHVFGELVLGNSNTAVAITNVQVSNSDTLVRFNRTAFWTYFTNSGTTPFQATYKTYLSIDNVLDASDSLVATTWMKNAVLAGGEEIYQMEEIYWNDLALDSYYIIVQVDEENLYNETEVGDNIFVKKVVVRDPIEDYSLVEVSLNRKVDYYLGDTIKVDFWIENIGELGTQPFTIELGVSTDEVLGNADDLMLSEALIYTTHELSKEFFNNIFMEVAIPEMLSNGDYFLYLIIKDVNGEKNGANNSVLVPITYNDQPLGHTEEVLATKNTLQCYPTIVDDELYIENSEINQTIKVRITNLLGMLMFEEQYSGNKNLLTISDFQTGVYLLEVQNSDGSYNQFRFIKR